MPDNWVKTSLTSQEYGLYEVDGYTVQGGKVTALLDYIPASELPEETEESVKEVRGDDAVDAKDRLAELLDCPYYIVSYGEEVDVFEVENKGLRHHRTFSDASDFGQWTMQIRDRAITKYTRDTSSWSSLERKLIENDVGAPGDLDSFLYQDGDIQAVIEWQTTNKVSPADHSNNRWFSDDINRWKPLWTISEQLDVPLIIVVWSPKQKYPGVRIKRVSDMTFKGPDAGLEYSVDQTMPNARSNSNTIASVLSDTIQET